MPTTRPGYIYGGPTDGWVAIGQEAAVNPIYYQATEPTGASTGSIWIDEDDDVPSIDSSLFYRWKKTAVGGETTLSGNDDASLPLKYTVGYEELYLNGVLLVRGSDYTATTGTTITGLTALVAGDVVTIMSQVAYSVGDAYTQSASDSRFVNKTVGGLNLIIPTSVTGGTLSTNGQISVSSGTSTTINGCFSSAYQNYRLVVTGASSTSSALMYTNTLSGTAATTNYSYALMYSNDTGGPAKAAATVTSNIQICSMGNYGFNSEVTISNPALADTTRTLSTWNKWNSQTSWEIAQAGGFHLTATAYDGFKIDTSTGTWSGTIRIYGYNNGA